MKKNHVRDKLKQGQPSLGTWLTLPDVVAARLMARAGFDWLTVELEHAPINWETAANSFAIIAASGVVPLARVPWNTRENIKRVLDNGAFGIVVPMVNSPSEAEAVVEAARYQPLGNRSVGGQLHAANFETDPATYYAKADEEILVVVMIEHVEAVAAADEILSVPGIDAVFIGPNDLLNSMGQPPAFDSHHKPFVDAVEHVLKTAHQHGIAAGMHTLDAEGARKRIAEGFQFIAVASEAGFMLSKAQEILRDLGISREGPVAKY
jgi:4-hydroxy-2-oxoheptanedioate aldolase